MYVLKNHYRVDVVIVCAICVEGLCNEVETEKKTVLILSVIL